MIMQKFVRNVNTGNYQAKLDNGKWLVIDMEAAHTLIVPIIDERAYESLSAPRKEQLLSPIAPSLRLQMSDAQMKAYVSCSILNWNETIEHVVDYLNDEPTQKEYWLSRIGNGAYFV